jgi:hypothetical protein
MAKVKVWNKNKFDHREKFKGEEIFIPAGGSIDMDFEEAIEFKGQFTPPAPKEHAGDPARFYKMIEVEWPKQPAAQPSALVNHADGTIAQSDAELRASLSRFADRLVKDEDAEKATAAQNSEVAALRAEMDELKALLAAQNQKRGPGRPPKSEGTQA